MKSTSEIRMFTINTYALILFAIIGLALALIRMTKGLGAATNLSDTYPWGIWLAFDVLGGVAMAAGGFIIACAVYLFNWKRYKPIARPAILTAFLGYLMAIVALFLDIGHPFRLWHPSIMWQVHSVMWVVAIHVILYTTTLAIESSPMLFEKLKWEKAGKIVDKIMIGAVVFGVMLSTLHQSSLGAVFLIAPSKMSPLWFNTWLPYLFLLSAITMGLAMVSLESILSARVFKHPVDLDILRGLARGLVITLSVYLAAKLLFLLIGPGLGEALNGSLEGNMYLLELAVGVLLPLGFLLYHKNAISRQAILAVDIMVITGVLVNRMNVCIFSMNQYTSERGASYFPSASEILITLGIVCLGILIFKLAVTSLNVFQETAKDRG